jgi:hypothetical protein
LPPPHEGFVSNNDFHLAGKSWFVMHAQANRLERFPKLGLSYALSSTRARDLNCLTLGIRSSPQEAVATTAAMATAMTTAKTTGNAEPLQVACHGG